MVSDIAMASGKARWPRAVLRMLAALAACGASFFVLMQAVQENKPERVWIRALSSRDPDVREETIAEIARAPEMNDPAVVDAMLPYLARTVDDQDSAVRRGAVGCLYMILLNNRALHDPAQKPQVKAVSAALMHALGSQDAVVRREAVIGLGIIGADHASTVPSLVRMLRDQDDEVRGAALHALSRLSHRSESALSAVIKAARGPDPNTRVTAIEALGHSMGKADAVIPALLRSLKDEDARVREAAEMALGLKAPGSRSAVFSWTWPTAQPTLIEALRDEDPLVRLAAVTALARSGTRGTQFAKQNEPVVEALSTVVGDANEAVRNRALESLGWIGGERAAQILIHEVRARGTNADQGIVWELGLAAEGTSHAGEAAVELIHLTKHPTREVRLAALRSLGMLRVPADEAKSLLRDSLADRDPEIRAAAVQALAMAGGRNHATAVLGDLIPFLNDEDKDVRQSVVLSLGWFGTSAEDAIPRLVEILKTSEPAYQASVIDTLSRIAPGTKHARAAATGIGTVLAQHDDQIKGQALNALVRFGADAEAVIPPLDRLVAETSGIGRQMATSVRNAIAVAVEKRDRSSKK